MAPETVLLQNGMSSFASPDDLRLVAEGERGGVIESVGGLEGPFSKDFVLRHMTVVAVGPDEMGAFAPGLVLRTHDMAIEAGCGIV
jgi:hypothetical protein